MVDENTTTNKGNNENSETDSKDTDRDDKLEDLAQAWAILHNAGLEKDGHIEWELYNKIKEYAYEALSNKGWPKYQIPTRDEVADEMAGYFLTKLMPKYNPTTGPVKHLMRKVFARDVKRRYMRKRYINDDFDRPRKFAVSTEEIKELGDDQQTRSGFVDHEELKEDILRQIKGNPQLCEDKMDPRLVPSNKDGNRNGFQHWLFGTKFTRGKKLTLKQKQVVCLYYNLPQSVNRFSLADHFKRKPREVKELLRLVYSTVKDHVNMYKELSDEYKSLKRREQISLLLRNSTTLNKIIEDFPNVNDRVLIFLYYKEDGYSDEEIGKVMGVTRQSVNAVRQSAIRKLHSHLPKGLEKTQKRIIGILMVEGLWPEDLTIEEENIAKMYYVLRYSDKRIGLKLGLTQQAVNKRRKTIKKKFLQLLKTMSNTILD